MRVPRNGEIAFISCAQHFRRPFRRNGLPPDGICNALFKLRTGSYGSCGSSASLDNKGQSKMCIRDSVYGVLLSIRGIDGSFIQLLWQDDCQILSASNSKNSDVKPKVYLDVYKRQLHVSGY